MVTEVRPEQREKAEFPILVTEFGMVMDLTTDLAKAKYPILVTELLILTDLRYG